MIDPRALIADRQCGEVRYAVLSGASGDLSQILGRCGLSPDASALVEHDRDAALAILVELLWKDMAYGCECMPRARAEAWAEQIIDGHATAGSRFYSNGNQARHQAWNPLTPSTFDAGVIIAGQDGTCFCLWFQDED